MSRNFLAGVGDSPTVGGEILKSYRGGEITFAEALTQWAVTTSDQCHEWKPAIYPTCPAVVRAYAQARVGGARGRDHQLARANGDWLHEVRLVKELNDSEIGGLLWSVEKVEAAKLPNQVAKLRNAIDRFHSAKFPYVDYRTSERAQNLDRLDRERQERVG